MPSKPLLTTSDYYYPVGVCIESVFYGFYTAVFIAAVWIWGKRRSRAATSAAFSGWLYLILIVLMWIVASLHFGITLQRFLRVYILELDVDSAPAAVRLLDAGRWDTLAHMILMTLMIWLGDVLVLYRTFVVWNKNIWVVALPILVHVSYLVINSFAIYALSHPNIFPRATAVAWYQPVFPLVFTQNVMTTGLLFYKIFSQHRASTANGVADSSGTIGLGQLAWMLIETAGLYTLELFVIIILGAKEHPAKGIVSVSLVPTLGIVFVLLSVRVHFGAPSANNTQAKSATANNLPDFFRDSVSDEGLELSQPVATASSTSDVDFGTKKLTDIDILALQNTDSEAQVPFPVVSFSRKNSREYF
ncbi:hypothetical protein BJ165DRAFT_1531633 [Panaeolus papilionaceus]|nr:hypothetical protein BJ165DRAFT_1531633 [Panaeolus papilionaceus]